MTLSEETEVNVAQSRSSVSEAEQARTLNRNTALACPDYNTYIASAVNTRDLFYIENPGVMRLMLENWANCDQIPPEKKRYLLSREEFDCLKFRNEEQTNSFSTDLAHKGDVFDLDSYRDSNFFSALTERITLIKQNKIHCIVFVRMLVNRKEISGYIDLASRLRKKSKTRGLVSGESVLKPRKSDLSFMDWSSVNMKQASQLSDSNFFKTFTKGSHIVFRSKFTGNEIHTDKENPGDNTERIALTKTFPYLQVVFFDHHLTSEQENSDEHAKNVAAFREKRRKSIVRSLMYSTKSTSTGSKEEDTERRSSIPPVSSNPHRSQKSKT